MKVVIFSAPTQRSLRLCGESQPRKAHRREAEARRGCAEDSQELEDNQDEQFGLHQTR
jgi:hypothetical protein